MSYKTSSKNSTYDSSNRSEVEMRWAPSTRLG